MTVPSYQPSSGPAPSGRFERSKASLIRLMRGQRASQRSQRTTIAILRAQQEATLDGILVVDQRGRILSYNQRFLEIWGIPVTLAATGVDEVILHYAADAVIDKAGFLALVEFLYAHPEEIRNGDLLALKDGRVLSRSSVPVVVDNGKITGRAWYFRDITEARKAEILQSALFRIAQLSRDSKDLDEFYAAVHQIVGELMDARNFYIAEWNSERDILTFPYFVDECDKAPEGLNPGRGLSAYVLRTGQPLLARPKDFEELEARGEVESVGAPSVDWLGVPLRTGERTWGVLGVQTYDESIRYTDRDKEILVFVSQHVASAIEHKRKEDAIRESEKRYRQMFENNRAVQLLIDPATGAIVDANMSAADFYGYTIADLRTKQIWDINVLGPEKLRGELKRASQTEAYFVFQHRRANGEIRDVEVHSGPIDVQGRQLLYSIIHDITERRRAEQALQQSEEKYRNIFDYASTGIYQSTLDGQLITVNNALAQMLGYDSPEDLLQRNLTYDIYYHTTDRQALIHDFVSGGTGADHEVPWRRKDGSLIWVQLNAHANRTPQGSVYFEGFVYDITERKHAQQALAAVNAQRKAVLDAATRASIIATDGDGLITVFNAGAERMLGHTADEVIGRRSILDLHIAAEIADHATGLRGELGRAIEGFDVLVTRAALRGVEEREWSYVRNDGLLITVLLSVTAIRAGDGLITGFLFVATDVTERKHTEETLSKQFAAMTASMDGIGILDDALEFTYLNDALARLYGMVSASEMLGHPLAALYGEEENARFLTTILPIVRQCGRWRGEAEGKRLDGTSFPQEISLTAIEGGGLVCVVRDITERTYAEEQIKHLAYHDALTGLPNRLLFKDRLTVALSHALRDKSRLAVLFLDLDRFKVINDSLGHNIGDQILQAVAGRVQGCVRESDTVARLGGDEFTLLLPTLPRSEDAAPVAQKILESLRHPLLIDGREFYITTSIGISLYPEDGTDAETLIKNADTAMYQAKEQGRDNYQLFNAYVNAKALQRIALEHGLRRALVNGEMAMHYQPIFDLRLGSITGMEALLRWQHPDLGDIPPAVFVPIAESTSTMVPIGSWALRTACRQAKAWHDAGYKHLSLAVNLSVCQLQQPDLVSFVRDVLAQTGMQARLLELEITESSAMLSPENSVRTLYELKKLGIRISLDDFGTGHSSLSYLKRFPIDTLKIDQSFVRDIDSDPDTAAIVTAIIAMAHSLRLKVIAEGVELTEQARFLKRHSCDQMQGFLIQPPVPAEEFLEVLGESSLQHERFAQKLARP